jgi:hypothetical protein
VARTAYFKEETCVFQSLSVMVVRRRRETQRVEIWSEPTLSIIMVVVRLYGEISLKKSHEVPKHALCSITPGSDEWITKCAWLTADRDSTRKRNLKTPIKTRTLHLSEPYDSPFVTDAEIGPL